MEEKEIIEIFENLIKDCTRVTESTQYAQNLQILSKANKALKKVKKNGVLHSVMLSEILEEAEKIATEIDDGKSHHSLGESQGFERGAEWVIERITEKLH